LSLKNCPLKTSPVLSGNTLSSFVCATLEGLGPTPLRLSRLETLAKAFSYASEVSALGRMNVKRQPFPTSLSTST